MKRREFVTGALTGAAVGAGAVILTKKTTLDPGTPQDPGNSTNVGGGVTKKRLSRCVYPRRGGEGGKWHQVKTRHLN